jgi:hypothetical protein
LSFEVVNYFVFEVGNQFMKIITSKAPIPNGFGEGQGIFAFLRSFSASALPFGHQVRAVGKDRKHRKPLNEVAYRVGSGSLLNETYDPQRPTLRES